MKPTKIAVFASGNGSNFQRIAEFFENHRTIKVELLLCNNPQAYCLERAKILGIDAICFTKKDFYETQRINHLLQNKEIDFIVLAGFLWLIPNSIINSFSGKIINIHPALLPNYGGKGMYGMHVHKAVVANRETQSGITIHQVTQNYDEGDVIFQMPCRLEPTDTPEQLAEKIHTLEHEFFPKIIEKTISQTREN